jgi:outer membrane biogenesis lipoprotein LolB
VGIFDNISTILYYDWKQQNVYSFFNWQHQLDRMSFYFMAFWNPQIFRLPQQNETTQLFSGKGFQLMLVYNH